MMKDTDYRSPTELHLSLMAKVHTEESGVPAWIGQTLILRQMWKQLKAQEWWREVSPIVTPTQKAFLSRPRLLARSCRSWGDSGVCTHDRPCSSPAFHGRRLRSWLLFFCSCLLLLNILVVLIYPAFRTLGPVFSASCLTNQDIVVEWLQLPHTGDFLGAWNCARYFLVPYSSQPCRG